MLIAVPPRGPLLDLSFDAAPPRRAAEDAAPLGVGELDRRLKRAVEGLGRVEVCGEVRGLREVSSGHIYFSLKDEREDATIDAVLYRTGSPRARALLGEGARVVLAGRATVWAPRGRLQFTVDDVRTLGRGALLEALERLKEKLQGEGLFAPERKRPLPECARVIGVVTSSDGAAIHDLASVAFRRSGVRLLLARAPAQGPTAAQRILRALQMLARHPEVEVIVLTRGGGSLDDLAAYDDEALARAIAACPVPVVSAVGHEIDVSLADLVADARAATPSQAAEMLVPDHRARRDALAQLSARLCRAARGEVVEQRRDLERLSDRLESSARDKLATRRRAIVAVERRLEARHPKAELARARAAVRTLGARLGGAMASTLARSRGQLGANAGRLDALSPLRVLARGYAIASDDDGRALRDAAEVEAGDLIAVRLHRGALIARVESTLSEGEGAPPSARSGGS